MRTTMITRAGWMVLAASVTACAPEEVEVMSQGQPPIEQAPITEREQYEGSIDPLAAHDHDTEPSPDVDGPVEGLAPRLDTSMVIDDGEGTGIHVDATTACRRTTGYSAGRPMAIC